MKERFLCFTLYSFPQMFKLAVQFKKQIIAFLNLIYLTWVPESQSYTSKR